MKVLLVRPDSPLVVTPVPMGLGALAHALKTRRGDRVHILDARRHRLAPESVLAEAARFGPDFIGVTSMTYESPEALALIARLKQRWPDLPVAIGGPHATGYGPTLLEKCEADFLVMGEGEDTIIELMNSIERDSDPSEVKGLAFRDKGGIKDTGCRPPIQDLERLGFDWDGMRPEDYFGMWTRNAMNTVARSGRRLPVFTSRGCPFGCAYCHHIFGRHYRTFPTGPMVENMLRLRDRYRVSEFEIIDDNFNLKLDRAKEFMQAVIDAKLGCAIAFTNGLRADRMDEELLDLMARAGVYRIDYAIESASERVQEIANKRLDLGRAREVVNMTARRGIVTGAYYMLGFPGETAEEMEATVEYALSLDNHVSSFFYLMPFPGTEFAEADPKVSATVRGRVFRDASKIALNLSATSDERMMRIKQRAYRDFYFSPARVARIVRDAPKNARLIASALAALQLSFREGVDY